MDGMISKVRSMYQGGDKKDMLLLALAVDTIFVFCLSICSLVVAGTANAGFNILLTATLNVAYVAGGYHVIKNSKTPIAVRNSLR